MRIARVVLAVLVGLVLGFALRPLLIRDVSAQLGPTELSVPAAWGKVAGYGVGPTGGIILFEAPDGTLRQWVVVGGALAQVIQRR
jgi:hypothetical protein